MGQKANSCRVEPCHHHLVHTRHAFRPLYPFAQPYVTSQDPRTESYLYPSTLALCSLHNILTRTSSYIAHPACLFADEDRRVPLIGILLGRPFMSNTRHDSTVHLRRAFHPRYRYLSRLTQGVAPGRASTIVSSYAFPTTRLVP